MVNVVVKYMYVQTYIAVHTTYILADIDLLPGVI